MNNSTRRTALIGVLSALTVISLLLAVTLTTMRLSFYALSSFFISIIIIEHKIPAGWLFYFTTNLLAYIIVPNKLGILPYTFFFGLYGIIKYYAEKANNSFMEFLIKYFSINICVFSLFFLAKHFFSSTINLNSNQFKYPIWTIILILQLVFFVYDYVYTSVIRYYKTRLRNHLRNGGNS